MSFNIIFSIFYRSFTDFIPSSIAAFSASSLETTSRSKSRTSTIGSPFLTESLSKTYHLPSLPPIDADIFSVDVQMVKEL